MKNPKSFPFILLGTSLLVVGAITYLYMCTHLEEEDVDFDLYDEETTDYL